MKTSRLILSMILVAGLTTGSAPAQQKVKLGENAALRYWSAFAQMQDSAITDQQVKELSAILDGTTPYDDSRYKDLIEKNKHALETMARGTALANCDWGLDYEQGPDTPIDYAPKAVALARLNVLYAFHLQIVGDKEGSVRALVAGLRFSRDAANGGSLLATLLAKDSLIKHLRAIVFMLHSDGLSAPQRSMLQKALAQLGPDPLNWQSAIKLEMDVLSGLPSSSSAPSARVTQAYVAALKDPSMLPKLQEVVATLPQTLQGLIPNPERVLGNRQELTDKLREVRSMLQ
jgi:hypothetical protein